MSIIHMDNFTIYGNSANLLNNVYISNNGCTVENDPDGVSPGKVLRIPQVGGGGGNYAHLRFPLPTFQTTIGMAGRFWLTALPTSPFNHPAPFVFKNNLNEILYSLIVTTTGRLAIRVGSFDDADSFVVQTTNPVVGATGWYHLEMKYFLSDTVGTLEVRVEGATVLTTAPGDTWPLTTGTATIAQVEIANDPTGTSSAVETFFKDLVIWDANGTQNNNFLGSVIVTNLIPTADAALNWVPSTGTTGFNLLDNIPPNGAEYITAIDPPPAPYVGIMSDLPNDVTSVKAIMTMVRAAKTDGGDASLQVGVISDPLGTPTTALGANRPINTTQNYWRDVFEVDPDTAAAWLPNAVNAARIRLNRTL
jgi:hypothetical protein